VVPFGRDITGDLALAESREWLCANGIGGFAMGPAALQGQWGPSGCTRFPRPLGRHIGAYGVGSLGEVFDGEPPHLPRGHPFQAWTMAEMRRAWAELGPRGRSG